MHHDGGADHRVDRRPRSSDGGADCSQSAPARHAGQHRGALDGRTRRTLHDLAGVPTTVGVPGGVADDDRDAAPRVERGRHAIPRHPWARASPAHLPRVGTTEGRRRGIHAADHHLRHRALQPIDAQRPGGRVLQLRRGRDTAFALCVSPVARPDARRRGAQRRPRLRPQRKMGRLPRYPRRRYPLGPHQLVEPHQDRGLKAGADARELQRRRFLPRRR